MSFSCNIPTIGCFVRAEYMRQHKDGHGTVYPAAVFGVSSLPGQVPLFHFHMEDGGIWWRMPISAFCSREDAKPVDLDELVLWDCFSYHIAAIRYEWLVNRRVEYTSRRRVKRSGRYLFTLDWCAPDGFSLAESAGQHKCGHVIELDDGNYAIQPNNRILAYDPSFTTKYGEMQLERLISDRIYSVEMEPRWKLSSDEKYDYDVSDGW
jgi:hypothetical protein